MTGRPAEDAIICLKCIGDDDLRSQLAPSSAGARCSYCDNRHGAVSIEELADAVAGPLRQAYGIGQLRPYLAYDADSPEWEQEGDDLLLLLQEELEIDVGPAEALLDALVEADPADPRDGDEPFFAHDQQYVRADVYGWEYAELWQDFGQRIKHERRFFDEDALGSLSRILGEPNSPEAADLPSLGVGPESKISRLFRARRASTADEARRLLADANNELGPPPVTIASAGRMNPAGIPVFYGAVSAEVAVAEVRPSIGGIVVVGEFELTKDCRLFDLSTAGRGLSGSIFSPGFFDRVARLRFLRSFHYLITRPVQIAEEVLEYVPTQAVAEYVGTVLGFDGILYASAQIGSLEESFGPEDDPGSAVDPQHCNVVLFGRVTRRGWGYDSVFEHPAKLISGSEHGVWITEVSYRSSRINLDDERGAPPEASDVAF